MSTQTTSATSTGRAKLEPPDLSEKGGLKGGVPQKSDQRLFMQLTAFGGRHRYDAILNVQFVSANGVLMPGGGMTVRETGDDEDTVMAGEQGDSEDRAIARRDDRFFRPVLRRHALRAQLTSRRELDNHRLDQTYHLTLRDPSRSRELLRELESTEGVVHVALYRREEESEA